MNDGIIYGKNVRAIFEEALNDAYQFFESWNENFETVEDFQNNVP